jgi:pantoate kinase
MDRVSAAYPLFPPKNVQDFFRISRLFAEKSGLLTRDARAVIRQCADKNIPASMTMLGNGVFAYGREAKAILSAFGEVYTFTVARSGARIIGV